MGLFTLLSRPFKSTPCILVVIATVPTLLISLHPRALLTCSQLTEVGALKQIVLRVGAVRTIHLSLLWLAAWWWREVWCGVVFCRIRNCLWKRAQSRSVKARMWCEEKGRHRCSVCFVVPCMFDEKRCQSTNSMMSPDFLTVYNPVQYSELSRKVRSISWIAFVWWWLILLHSAL